MHGRNGIKFHEYRVSIISSKRDNSIARLIVDEALPVSRFPLSSFSLLRGIIFSLLFFPV